ncbi:MAG: hypothetical protein JWM34_3867 [Ilumatobacteraceae bacterium]|nr:hypothetical protein [Ilumatobacteraceae bacterium]
MASPRVKPVPVQDTPLKQLAAELLVGRTEIAPSLDLISNSALSEDDKMTAMRLFEGALDDPWHEMRDPRKAIAAVAAQAAD